MYGRRAIGTVAYLGGLPAVLEKFCWCWGQMLAYNEEFLADDFGYVHTTKANFSEHAPARNDLVNRMLGDFLLQMDTDHEFEPDILGRLLRLANDHDIDVLTGLYRQKGYPYVPVLYRWTDTDVGPMPSPIVGWSRHKSVVTDEIKPGIIQIGSAGGGCLFVRRRVFERIAEAYKCGPFDKIHPYSEDHSFFFRCKELDIKCYAAVDVHSYHLRVAPVTDDDFDPTYAQMEMIEAKGFG